MVSVLRKRSSAVLAAAETGTESVEAPAQTTSLKVIATASIAALCIVGSAVVYSTQPSRQLNSTSNDCFHWSQAATGVAGVDDVYPCCDTNFCQTEFNADPAQVNCVACVTPAPAPATCAHFSDPTTTGYPCCPSGQCQTDFDANPANVQCVACVAPAPAPTQCTHYAAPQGQAIYPCCPGQCQTPFDADPANVGCTSCGPAPTTCPHFSDPTSTGYPCCTGQCQSAFDADPANVQCVSCDTTNYGVDTDCYHYDQVRCPGPNFICCDGDAGQCQNWDGTACESCPVTPALQHNDIGCPHYDGRPGLYKCCWDGLTCQSEDGLSCELCVENAPSDFNQHLCCPVEDIAAAACLPGTVPVCCGHDTLPADAADVVASRVICVPDTVDISGIGPDAVCNTSEFPLGAPLGIGIHGLGLTFLSGPEIASLTGPTGIENWVEQYFCYADPIPAGPGGPGMTGGNNQVTGLIVSEADFQTNGGCPPGLPLTGTSRLHCSFTSQILFRICGDGVFTVPNNSWVTNASTLQMEAGFEGTIQANNPNLIYTVPDGDQINYCSLTGGCCSWGNRYNDEVHSITVVSTAPPAIPGPGPIGPPPSTVP
eukprot:GFYU01000039.1.p2 GENE.GFYU01000039.1~~GFYU01000039.1.p2  ORF type:complete len:597 (+),score=156.46 GFYU01000039.1:28-1818(+)